MQSLEAAQGQASELAAALEASQNDTIILSQALEEGQIALDQKTAESEAQSSAMQVRAVYYFPNWGESSVC